MSSNLFIVLRSILFSAAEQKDYLENITSHADAINKHLYNIDILEFINLLEVFFLGLMKYCKKLPFSNGGITIAFDETFIPYYGRKRKENIWIHGYKNGWKGASGTYKFMAASVILQKKRFVLFMLPMATTDNSVAFVDDMLIKIKKYFRVNFVQLDRGFASKEAVYNLEKQNVKYIILCPRWSNISKLLKKKTRTLEDETYYYKLKHRVNVTMKYVFAYDFFGHNWVFLTNTNYKTPLALILYYKGRWGIETSFRVMDEADIKSKSTIIVIRTFFMIVSIVLYNQWIDNREELGCIFRKYLDMVKLSEKNPIQVLKELKEAKIAMGIPLTKDEENIFNKIENSFFKKKNQVVSIISTCNPNFYKTLKEVNYEI